MFITVHGHHQIWSLLLLLLSVFYIINVDTGSQALSRQTPLLLAVIKHWDTPHSALGSPSPCGFHAASTCVGERARERNWTSSPPPTAALHQAIPPILTLRSAQSLNTNSNPILSRATGVVLNRSQILPCLSSEPPDPLEAGKSASLPVWIALCGHAPTLSHPHVLQPPWLPGCAPSLCPVPPDARPCYFFLWEVFPLRCTHGSLPAFLQEFSQPPIAFLILFLFFFPKRSDRVRLLLHPQPFSCLEWETPLYFLTLFLTYFDSFLLITV